MKREDYPQNVRYGKEPVLAAFRPAAAERTPFNRHKPTAKLRRGMSEAHLNLIRMLPCCVSAVPRRGSRIDPHHLKNGGAMFERGTGQKSTDRWAVPLDENAHRCDLEMLGSRNELAWFMQEGCINPYALANALWCATGDLRRMQSVILHHKLIGSPWKKELERLHIGQIRIDDLHKDFLDQLRPSEYADVTPQQVVTHLARRRGLLIRLDTARRRSL